MRLRHRRLGAIEAVAHQLTEEWEADLAGEFDVAFALVIDDVEMIAADRKSVV